MPKHYLELRLTEYIFYFMDNDEYILDIEPLV